MDRDGFPSVLKPHGYVCSGVISFVSCIKYGRRRTTFVPRRRRRRAHASARLQFERGQPADMSLALVSILSKLDEETRDHQVSSKRANDGHYIAHPVCCNGNTYPTGLTYLSWEYSA